MSPVKPHFKRVYVEQLEEWMWACIGGGRQGYGTKPWFAYNIWRYWT